MATTNLPEEMMEDIISRLPVPSLLRFRCVNKHWLSLISGPNFIKTHLQRATPKLMLKQDLVKPNCKSCTTHFTIFNILDDVAVDTNDHFDDVLETDNLFSYLKYKVQIFGCCDGLFLVKGLSDIVCVLNPSTREFHRLPYTAIESKSVGRKDVLYGFGYDPVVDDYKVVSIIYFYKSTDEVNSEPDVKVYALGSRTWRKSNNVPDRELPTGSSGVYANGGLHWLPTGDPTLIVVFDLVYDRFRVLSLPCYLNNASDMRLVCLSGRLNVLGDFNGERLEVWEMKDYGVKDSWAKLFTISHPDVYGMFDLLRPLGLSTTGEEVLLEYNNYLVWYHLKHDKSRELKVPRLPDIFETHVYYGSLVSLKSNEYLGQERKKGPGYKRQKVDC